jgi:hypothetical protein
VAQNMIYDMIYQQLTQIFNISANVWAENTTMIIAYVLTGIFVLIFLLIPWFLFVRIFGLLDEDDNGQKGNYSRKKRK